MTLSDEARERLVDVVELQPTKNKELQDRWGMESGSEVHSYLESELGDYYYRDENSLIRVNADGVELVGGDPDALEDDRTIVVSPMEYELLQRLAGPDERSQSVVSVLHDLREATDFDPDVDEVRRSLQRLKRAGLVEVEYRTVPTFRLAVARDDLNVEVEDD